MELKWEIDVSKILEMIIESSFIDENWYFDTDKEYIKEIVDPRKCMDKEWFKELVLESFKQGKVIKLNGEWHRCIGKTSFIAKISNLTKFPIITDLLSLKKVIKESHNCENVYTYNEFIGMEGKFKYVLVDERIGIQDVDNLRKKGYIVLGFVTTYKCYELY